MNKKFSLMAFLLVPLMSSSYVAAQDLPSNMLSEKIIQENADQEANASWRIIKMIEDAKQKGLSGNQLVEYVLQIAQAEGYQKDQILNVINENFKKAQAKKIFRYTLYVVGAATILYLGVIIFKKLRNKYKEDLEKKIKEEIEKNKYPYSFRPKNRSFSPKEQEQLNALVPKVKPDTNSSDLINLHIDLYKTIDNVRKEFPDDTFLIHNKNQFFSYPITMQPWNEAKQWENRYIIDER